ncbi:MAG: 2,3-bisphosphoglycerate-independent phosphoglycerate mutase [Planctomycetes bacterium]|nr:2,3-bisphosphoglycerate-independent phosphoglycerate mutase [Planctomycetota bacterium]
MPAAPKPVMLVIMDGWGLAPPGPYNAVHVAKKPNYDRLTKAYPYATLKTSGADVGLPGGTMGNSEVGHLNIGAGRVVWQDLLRISRSIEDGSFFKNPALVGAAEHAKRNNSRLHLFGLVSGAFVHSAKDHYVALARLAKDAGLKREQVVYHLFTDGRDTAPHSGKQWVGELQAALDETGVGIVGTVIGRYYAMDRDKRWPRTKLAYEAMVHGTAEFTAKSALEAVENAYAREAKHAEGAKYPAENDEFIRPTVIVDAGGKPQGLIRGGDAAISFNHRSDRPRQIVRALIEKDFEAKTAKDPSPGWARGTPPKIHLVTLTDYRAGFDCPVAFDANPLGGTLAEAVANAGLKQYHSAETEKYPHVTFFLNGGREEPFPGEERYMAASPKVATYDLQPEMSAAEVTQHAVDAIKSGKFAFLMLNYANGDMVGHTGVLPAAVKAVETVDAAIGKLCEAMLAAGGEVLITADHGNCEQMWDEESNGPHTAHTTNPVPVFLVSERHKKAKLISDGRLADLAPTVLHLLGVPPTKEMDGRCLLSK